MLLRLSALFLILLRGTASWPILWTANEPIPYFIASDMPETHRAVIHQAIEFYSRNTCVRFVERFSRILFGGFNIIHGDGCYAPVGWPGIQIGPIYIPSIDNDISLGDGCQYFSTAAHEIGHILGVSHTHERWDRDDYVTIDAANIRKEYENNFEKEDFDTYGVPYDYGSVMHYSTYAMAIDKSEPVIRTEDPLKQYSIGNLRGPTITDLLMVNRMYSCDAKCAGKESICKNSGFLNPNDCSECICPFGFAGRTCAQRPKGYLYGRHCGEAVYAKAKWQILSIGPVYKMTRREDEDEYTCHWHITSRRGRNIEIRLKRLAERDAFHDCRFEGVELKLEKFDQQLLQESHPRRVARSVSYYSEPSNEDSTATQTYYFPLYTQLSSKSIDKLCKTRNQKEQPESEDKSENETVHKAKFRPENTKKISRKQETKEKTCKEIKSLGGKTLIGARLHRVGGAIRSGEKWLLTEFSTGYSVFEYRTNGSDSISSNDPYRIHTLNDPFQGTDHTIVGNGRTFVYNTAASKIIQFANLYTKRILRRSLNISNDPLYHHSFSYVDIEFDESAVWVIYRKPHDHHLTVSRFDSITFSEKARWSLTHVPIEKNITNCFVACGVLHTVSTVVSHGRSTNRITAVFDFDAGSYIHQNTRMAWEWKGYGVPSNMYRRWIGNDRIPEAHARVSAILYRRKRAPEEVTSSNDFVTIHESFKMLDFLNCHWALYCLDRDYALFVELPYPTTFYEAKRFPFCYVPFFEQATRVAYVTIDSLIAHGKKLAETPQPRTVLFTNTARCGSTLMAQMLSLHGVSVCFAEPHVLTNLSYLANEGYYTEEFLRRVIPAVINFFRKDVPSNQICMIKTASTETRLVPLFDETVPDLTHMFMCRKNGLTSVERLLLRDKTMRPVLEIYNWFPHIADIISLRCAGDGDFLRKLYPRNILEWAAIVYGAPYSHYLKNKKHYKAIAWYQDVVENGEKTISDLFEKIGIPLDCVPQALERLEHDSQGGTCISRSNQAGVKVSSAEVIEEHRDRLEHFAVVMEIPQEMLLGDGPLRCAVSCRESHPCQHGSHGLTFAITYASFCSCFD
ncbi:hypothetical protein QR680_011350 [Steinernema hermaphroditum]|uniref:Metalloendopeptidase n=1 Tax=Steinernema hermaphroditum TaxID=289476 RepID=A0AA39MD27_9BILA|nr:hypothetical protein QR680_011350 [Steinernema hermaphroditum]